MKTTENKKISFTAIIISILIPIAVGAIAGLLSMNSHSYYDTLQKPMLAPPAYLFPIVWNILYVLMGISSYLVYRSDSFYKKAALLFYGVLLLLNFIWPILYFNLQQPFAAFVLLCVMWIVLVIMTMKFYRISEAAGYLQIPHLMWVTFALYLNFFVYYLNR